MSKIKFNHILIVAVTLSLAILTPVEHVNAAKPNPNVVIEANKPLIATASTPNGQTAPWDERNGQMITQKLHHGNEITYRFATDQTKIDPKLYQVEQAGIKAWNSLGVIKLVPVKHDAEITIHTDYQYLHAHKSKDSDVNNQTIGLTTQSAVGQYYHATDITFMHQLKHYNTHYQYQVVQHELGHALGFEHEPKPVGLIKTIMTPYENPNHANVTDERVRTYFQQALQYHYDL